MSDSENEINPGIFSFQSGNTTVNASGPNIRFQRPFQFRNNGSSSMYMPQQRYAESVWEQRSMRREISPMSTYSAFDSRPWNFQQYNGMRSTQSVFNGRCGSSVSARSIDTTASASVADILFAFKNNNFSKHDERAIEEAISKWRRQRRRNRIQRRRNMRSKRNLKESRCRADYDSGEQGSDSSLSSHNSHSETISYKENGSRLARAELLDSRKVMKGNNPFIGNSQSSKQYSSENMFSMYNSNNFNRNQKSNHSIPSKHLSATTQKDRFKNGLALPSQRFNPVASSSVLQNNSEVYKRSKECNNNQNDKVNQTLHDISEDKSCESDSEEEIFSGTNRTIREKIAHDWIIQNKHKNGHELQGKRHRNSDDDLNLPNGKKIRTHSPVKNFNSQVPSKAKIINPVNKSSDYNNFEFTKPLLPVRKLKTKIQERMTSKEPAIRKIQEKVTSKQLLISPIKSNDNNNTLNMSDTAQVVVDLEKSLHKVDHIETSMSQNNEVSMRPSFIKRKLFTQKLDIAEKANNSRDSINSPQKNEYNTMQKEKNKARKLVTTQSCLSRDVQDDNNYLDLIHKIVPPGSINKTNQSRSSQFKEDTVAKTDEDDDDKWDVTSIISVCNENDGSDTFTDDDISKTDHKITDNKANEKKNDMTSKQKVNMNSKLKCVVNLQKIDIKNTDISNGNFNKSIAKSFAKKFWDSDFETDIECETTIQKSSLQANRTRDDIVPAAPKPELKQTILPMETSPLTKPLNNKNKIAKNNIFDSTGKLNINMISLKSHRMSTKKKCCNETCIQETTTKPQVKNVTPKIQIQNIQTRKRNTPVRSNKHIVVDRNSNNLSRSKTNKKMETPNKTTQKRKSNSNKENICKYLLASPIRRSPRIQSMKDKKTDRPQRSCRTSGSGVI